MTSSVGKASVHGTGRISPPTTAAKRYIISKAGHGKDEAPTGPEIGPEYTIQRVVRTGRHDDTCRIHPEPFRDLGFQGSGVGIVPEPGQIRHRQILEELRGGGFPSLPSSLSTPGSGWVGPL